VPFDLGELRDRKAAHFVTRSAAAIEDSALGYPQRDPLTSTIVLAISSTPSSNNTGIGAKRELSYHSTLAGLDHMEKYVKSIYAAFRQTLVSIQYSAWSKSYDFSPLW